MRWQHEEACHKKHAGEGVNAVATTLTTSDWHTHSVGVSVTHPHLLVVPINWPSPNHGPCACNISCRGVGGEVCATEIHFEEGDTGAAGARGAPYLSLLALR